MAEDARPEAPLKGGAAMSRRRAVFLAVLIRLLLVVAAVVALLPFAALARGLVDTLRNGAGREGAPGVILSMAALLLGSIFFLYSVRYYLASLVMLLSSVVLTGGNGNGNGHGKGGGNGHPNGLMRLLRRGNGHGNGHGNGNGNGHFELGYEPFVSIHIATYNEKRVIGRLLEGCAALEYGSYEVIVVDDSTDETTTIMQSWQGRPGFKLIHRANRDGFKGGALQVALEQTDPRAEFVIVWDADVVPFPDSIQTFLPHFFKANGNGGGNGSHAPEPRPEVAAVQSYQWHILNKSENWLTEAVRAEYAGSYMVERPFQEFVGSLKMIAGTAYMIRARLLRQLGWGRSLTEDWELTLRLHALGYKVVYTPYAESPAECVATLGRLARQRMRWAEGHSFNVRRRFGEIMRSPHLTFVEKVEFLYYSSYYLQAALFVLGSGAWLVAEVFMHAHVPDWTATLGWTLLLSNLLALPIMNTAGLLLEGAPFKDFVGVAGALATSFILVPFQAYAALKGLFEKDEGPWYRTPKTGRVTDPVRHLRRLRWIGRWLSPGRPVRPPAFPPAHRATTPGVPARPKRWLGWAVIGALVLGLGGVGYAALHAPVAQAAGSLFYMHGAASYTMDGTSPVGAQQTFGMTAAGAQRIWATTSTTTSSQTILSTTGFVFNYWTAAAAATSNADLTFGYSSSPTCSAAIANVRIGTEVTTLLSGNVTITLPASTAGDLLVAVLNNGTNNTFTGPAGWTRAVTVFQLGDGTNEIWYRPNIAGGAVSAAFTSASTSALGQLSEWSGVATASPLDKTGTVTALVPAASATVTATATAAAGELGITEFTSVNPVALSSGAGWSSLFADAANATISDYRLNVGPGDVSETATAFPAAIWAGAIATFKPAPQVTTIASSAGVTLSSGANSTASFSPAANVTVPAGSYFCWTVAINSVTGGGLTLDYDAAATPTNLNATQTIFIPELVLPLAGLALLAPLASRLRRRRAG